MKPAIVFLSKRLCHTCLNYWDFINGDLDSGHRFSLVSLRATEGSEAIFIVERLLRPERNIGARNDTQENFCVREEKT